MNAVAGNSTSRVAAAATINVDTYVHVVTTSSKAGNYPQSMIDEQVSWPAGCLVAGLIGA